MRLLTLFVTIYAFLPFALGQNGSVDLTFNPNDQGYHYGDGFEYDEVRDLAIQSDGKILVGGEFNRFDSIRYNGIIRLDTTGDYDNTFQIGDGFRVAIGGSQFTGVNKVLPLANGKILVGGEFNYYNQQYHSRLVKLFSDGSIDNNFIILPQAPMIVNDLLPLDNGRILVVGNISNYNSTTVKNMVITDSNGFIDPAFNTNLGSNGEIYIVKIRNDGKIVLLGDFSEFNGIPCNDIVLLNPDFSLDLSFNSGSGFAYGAYSARNELFINNDNSIYIHGTFLSYNNATAEFFAKINPDGSLDNSYPPNDFSQFSVKSIAYDQNDNKMFVGFFIYQNQNYYAFKEHADGSFSFPIDSNYLFSKMDYGNFSQFDLSNRLIVVTKHAGYFFRAPVLRYKTDGSLDDSFVRFSGANNVINDIRRQNDNRLIVFGDRVHLYNGKPVKKIFRILENGTFDTTFNLDFNPISINRIIPLDNGKYLVAGITDNANQHIFQLNSTGTIDLSYQMPTVFPGAPNEFAIQNDHKVVFIGDFTSCNGQNVNKIMRLNEDGTLDQTFNSGSGLSISHCKIIIQPDQKILLIRGVAFTYNGTSCNGIIRLNQDGSIDNSFNIGSGFNSGITSACFENNRLLLGGDFTSFNGVAANRIVCLLPDGSIDPSFDSGTGFDSLVTSLHIQSDGKILVGGLFSSYNQVNARGVVRLNIDGTIDQSIDFGSIPFYDPGYLLIPNWKPRINAFADLPSERIIVVGEFTDFNGVGRNRIAALYNCSPHYDTLNVDTCDSYTWNVTGQTYLNSGLYSDTLQNVNGCDSIVVLDLQINLHQTPTISTFSFPSSADTCIGVLAATFTGNGDYNSTVDGINTVTHDNYHIFNSICAGIHQLSTTDHCGDTATTVFVIPIDSNYVFNNPFIDSLALDSLGNTAIDCEIYYNGIDTAFIDSLWSSGTNVSVVWNIIDASGNHTDTSSYNLNNGNGVYWVQLSIYCPTRATGDYFTVTQAIYFYDGNASTVGLADLAIPEMVVYPNPTNSSITFKLSADEALCELYDSNGKLLINKNIKNGDTLFLNSCQNGVYFVKCFSEGKAFIEKIVKL